MLDRFGTREKVRAQERRGASCAGAASRGQAGFTLLEVGIAVVVAGIAASWGLWALSQNVEASKARMQGEQLAMLGGALSDYARENFIAIASGSAVTGFANAAQPTIAELRTAGFLDATFSANSLYGTTFTLRVTRAPACTIGATAPGCNVTSVAYLSAPMQFRGDVAWASLGSAVSAMGAHGGFSSQATPAVLSSANGTWTSANPAGSTAGILAYRDVYGHTDNSAFLRRDGAFPMVGNLQMGGNDIRSGGGSIRTEGGQINTAGGQLSTGGGQLLTQNGNIVAGTGTISGGAISGSSLSSSGAVTAGSFSTSGTITGGAISGSSLTTSGAVSASTVTAGTVTGSTVTGTTVNATNVNGTNITASGQLQGGSLTINGSGALTLTGGRIAGLQVASVGGGCSPSGSLAVSSAGEVLSCQAGRWKKQSTDADGGLVIDRIGSPGGGCSPSGAVARTSAGMLLSCQAGTWVGSGGSVPPGTRCGATDYPEGAADIVYATCQGHNARWTCPSGYYSSLVGSAASHWFFSCIKS